MPVFTCPAGVNVLGGVALVLVLLLEEALRVLVPGPEVILVEDDQVPVLFAHPLVLGLDAPVAPAPQEVLERFETHDGAGLVGRLGLVPLRLLRFEPVLRARCLRVIALTVHASAFLSDGPT